MNSRVHSSSSAPQGKELPFLSQPSHALNLRNVSTAPSKLRVNQKPGTRLHRNPATQDYGNRGTWVPRKPGHGERENLR